MALNKSGNYKGGTFLKKIPGQGVKTHDIVRGVSFKDKTYKRLKKGWTTTKAASQKVYGKIGKSYTKYGKPTETLFRKTGAAALGVGKFALKRGALGFPGLAATGLYFGGKHIIKKGEKIAKRSATKQWSKRDRFGRTRWYL